MTRPSSRWRLIWKCSGWTALAAISIWAWLTWRTDRSIDDVRLMSVSEVDLRKEAAFAPWRPDPSEDKIPASRFSLLKISVTSGRNLFRFADRHEFNIGIDVFDCQTQNGVIDSYGGGRVYWREIEVDPYAEANGKLVRIGHPDDQGRTNIYDGYIAVRRDKPDRTLHNVQFPAYDLRKHPLDLCLRIRGGNMLAQTFASNVALVHKADIERALNSQGVRNLPEHAAGEEAARETAPSAR